MLPKSTRKAFSALALAGLCCIAQPGLAQPGDVANMRVGVTTVTPAKGASPLQTQVLDLVRKAFIKSGFQPVRDPDYELLVLSEAVPEARPPMVALSVTAMQALPQQVVQFNARNETFYLAFMQDKPAPAGREGRRVREEVTSEFLEQYRNIVYAEMLVVPRAELENTCAQIVRKFLDFHFKQGSAAGQPKK